MNVLSNNELTEEAVQTINNWLNKHNSLEECCDKSNWEILPQIHSMPHVKEVKDNKLQLSHIATPLVVLCCSECGQVASFHAKSIFPDWASIPGDKYTK